MTDIPGDQFPPYDEWSSVAVQAVEVPPDAFDPAAADFDAEGVAGEHDDEDSVGR